ncbi:sensor histidine kinase [Sphingomonas aracearum]|uniref:C4-dicarboxylate transport sensor protein DctB n=1 Tax=Sphingomonas aracearum TaxID=2283317 RepID=A0A369VXF4_9SPHN|nr:ATP-binding protein [Sphingomonas aracearum]RDE07054.1 sensor histidine kinase [Sphingomonas aracearum]
MNRRSVLLLCVAALLLIAAAAATWRWAEARAEASASAAANSAAAAHVGLLASELQKFRLLPLVLVEYPDVAAALAGGDAAAGRRLDGTLELLARRTDASALYAIDARGRTAAASNWRLPTSFVGQDYGFRPYFREAMRRGASELFALGTVSGRPGLYLARRVDRGGRALGVVVVKVEFDAVERAWARAPGISFVTDRHGVVLVTSRPDWRFRATGALDAKTIADARATLQFGAAPPRPLPLAFAPGQARDGRVRFRVASVAAPLVGSHLIHLAPLGPPLAAARTQALLWATMSLLLVGGAAGLAMRAAETRRMQHAARAALEEEVARRTAELRDANAALIVESQERAEAERRFRTAREELAQANRLGTLGQISAGVAHEINQPVAAIRTFAENGETFLDRDRPERTRENLGHIVQLTVRIAAITAELRAFARRRTPAGGDSPLNAVIDGMRLLLGEQAAAVLRVELPDDLRTARVRGDRIRLEQVLVNLVTNALDAVEGVPDASVRIAASAEGETIRVAVTDNGPGVAAEVRETLFTPFATARPGGLGLGLAIARDIAREFGGDLHLAPGGGGASFLLTLRRA